ncbi:MAG TPA: hypothetical protein VFX12_08615 [Vicinamibacterales bacterium]|nr:hypothetical protein [Vicinamibacterales bacterium]
MLGLLVECLGEILFAIAGAVLQEAISDEAQSNRWLATIGYCLMGAIAGAISLLVLHRHVAPRLIVPGVSLIIAPVCTGAVLNILGNWWVRRGNVRMALFTFWGGFWFALAMATVRLTDVEHLWRL